MKKRVETKRAEMTSEELVKIALFLVVIVLLIVLAVKYLVFMGSASDTEKCRASVLAKSYTTPGGTSSPIPLICKTRYLKVKEDGAYLYDRRSKDYIKQKYPKFSGNLEADIGTVVAEEMANCWYEFGEGSLDPWSQWQGSLERCVICSEISFNEAVPEKAGSFNLRETLNKKMPSKDMGYSTYLWGANMTEDVELPITTYSVVYKVWAERDFSPDNIWLPLVSHNIIWFMWNTRLQTFMAVYVFPSEEIAAKCDKLF